MFYPVQLTADSNGSFLVTCPDIPEMASVGEDKISALKEAVDGLETALDFYFDERRAVPMPSKALRGQACVALPTLVSAKVLLHNEMLAQNVRKADLARLLNLAPPNVERIFNLRHKTKIETVEAAFACLGKSLEVHLV